MDREIARAQMIGQQLRAWEVLDARILEVMGSLPRECFVPPDWRDLAYADAEIPIGAGKLLAPPKIQGRALQAVNPRPGERALEIGLVSAVVPRADLMARSKELLRKVTKNGPVAVRFALESVYRALDSSTAMAMDHEASLFGMLATTEDMKEGLGAFLEKRKPGFTGR